MGVITGIDYLDTPSQLAHGNNGSNSVQLPHYDSVYIGTECYKQL